MPKEAVPGRAGASDRGARRLELAGVVAGAVAFIWLRAQFAYDDFPNPDMAGMAYNADVLLRGGLPYRDTVEFKSPGTFFVYAACFAAFGRALMPIQIAYAGWLASGAVAVWLASRHLYRDSGGGRGLAAGLYLGLTASFAPNYAAWMVPAYAWAFAAVVVASARGSPLLHGLAGAWAGIAFLFKAQACVLAVVFVAVWSWARRRGWGGANVLAPLCWVLGGLLAFAPLVGRYAWAGALESLWRGVVPVAVASDYATSSASVGLDLAWRVPGQLITVFPLGSMLAAVAAFGAWRTRRVDTLVPAAVLLLAAVLAAGLGGQRYYLHYLVQYVPGLAVIAAHPAWIDGLTWSGRRASTQRVARLVGAGLVVVGVGLELGRVLRTGGHRYEAMARRLEDGRTPAQAVGEHIRVRSGPDETMWAWGWTAWRAYFWADRAACTAVYKPMGVLTTFNQNTAFSDGGVIMWRAGPRADEVV
ncbi:MAG: hypothetical protein B7733_12340, partial [Myxococcales bacterium FL481]